MALRVLQAAVIMANLRGRWPVWLILSGASRRNSNVENCGAVHASHAGRVVTDFRAVADRRHALRRHGHEGSRSRGRHAVARVPSASVRLSDGTVAERPLRQVTAEASIARAA